MIPRLHSFDVGFIGTPLLVALLQFAMGDPGFGVAVVLGGCAIFSTLCCRWYPGLEAPAWKLWPFAWLFNPLGILTAGILIVGHECALGWVRGKECGLLLGVGVVAGAASLLMPLPGLVVRWLWRHLVTSRS